MYKHDNKARRLAMVQFLSTLLFNKYGSLQSNLFGKLLRRCQGIAALHFEAAIEMFSVIVFIAAVVGHQSHEIVLLYFGTKKNVTYGGLKIVSGTMFQFSDFP